MTTPFRTRIRASLANPGLQDALDKNAEHRLVARQTAFDSLTEELQVLRQRAHALRAETIANLNQYLSQFIAKVQTNGILVHRAADAAQANQIILDILRQNQAHKIIKSKTMVGEEIEVNQALEAAGFEVVETDLGEYIVQLRGERPGHIITPAVHLLRSDVARTFQEKIGLPYNEDIPTMTAAARRILRQTFLDAQAGISGVNFGVAETGTLCLVTNEGNGRMVTTLPPVHIALMGIERLVPTLDDLALLLSLLPRFSTGQKLSVYTSLIHGPRRPGELDGPNQRHLVLIDNGRSALANSPLAEILYCIRCGACLNACPVFREIGGHAYVGIHDQPTAYSGPIGSVISPALFGQPEFGNLARASSLCGACKEACPVDIDLPKLLLRIRAGVIHNNLTPGCSPLHGEGKNLAPTTLHVGLRAFTWIARSPTRYAAALHLAGFFSRLLAPFSSWLRLPAFTGWGYRRDFPRPASHSFRGRYGKSLSKPATEQQAISTQPTTIGNEQTPIRSIGSLATKSKIQPLTSNLLDRFEAELTALGGSLVRCKVNQLPKLLLAFLNTRGINRLQTWDAASLPDGLLTALEQAGIQAQSTPSPEIKVGLTGALAGIAETGTLLLSSAPGQPLTASLLPEIHLIILNASDLTDTLLHAFQQVDLCQSAASVLISGPSRTADIEMTLTIGVHGPGDVHVFCIE